MAFATNLQSDFELDGNGYMLWRDPRGHARSWVRSGIADSLGTQRRIVHDVYTNQDEYGGLPDEVDHPDVFDDWSGGFGDFYFRPSEANHYHFGYNADARFPRQIIHAQQPNVLPSRYASVNLNADAFMDVPLPLGSGAPPPPAGAGAVLHAGRGFVAAFTPTPYYSTPGSAFDFHYEATGGGGLGFGHKGAVFGSFSYLPNTDGSGFYQRGHDGTTYTLSDKMPARWFTVAAGRMWRSHGRGYLQSVAIGADPLVTGNWSATLNIGNGAMISDAAQAFEDRIFVGLPDGMYLGDSSGTFFNVATELGESVTSDSVRDLTTYDDGVVMGFGPHVYRYKPSSGANSEMLEVGPVGLNTNRSAIRGRFTCFKGFGPWMYGGLFTGSQSYVMCSRVASAGLPYVWQPMQLLPSVCKVNRIHVDGVSTTSGGVSVPPRMWVATEASFGAQTGCTAPTYWWTIPTGDNNPIADMTFSANYCGSMRLDMGQSNWQIPSVPKVWRALEVIADNLLSGSQYIDVYYTVDGGSRLLLGTATQSPRSVLYFPGLNNPNNNAFIRGNAIAISLESFTASLNVTPVVRSVVPHGFARPTLSKQVVAKVHIADGLLDRRGSEMRPGATMLSELHLMEISDSPQLLTDLTGAQSWVAVIPPIQEEEVYQGGSDYPDLVATVKMAVMDFTTNFVSTAGQNNSLANYTNDQLAQYTNAQCAFL